jgi:adenosylcobinamide-phosphate synthase
VSALVGGYAADLLLGDPERLHPVAGFGQLAGRIERAIYAPTRARGAAYALSLMGLAAVSGELLARLIGRRAALLAVLWGALGGRSLVGEASRIAALLDAGDLPAARAALPALAGRDPEHLDADGVCRAVVESVAENTSDAVVCALLWGAVAGPAGVAAYRAANTLDAMVGHRSERYASFGWAAARLDDAASWPGARAAAGLAALLAPLVGGSPGEAWHVLRRDGGAHPSPNAGLLEASFAGALGLRLGGPLSYAGRVEERPVLGDGRAPTTADVRRAIRLSLAVGAVAAGLAAAARATRSRPLAAATARAARTRPLASATTRAAFLRPLAAAVRR